MGSFDDLLEELEGTGWYQKRVLYLLLCPIFFLMPFAFLNNIFLLHIPNHWCTPPEAISPETLNISLDAWKATFLPMELGPDYLPRSSQCAMYSVNNETLPLFLSHQLPGNRTDLQTVTCEEVDGYSYDQSEMLNTVVSDNDWVCTKQTRATNLFTLGVVGLIIGTAIFSALADFKGRKLSFFLSTIFMITLSLIQIFVSHNYGAYIALQILSFATMLPLFQSPMNITTEISTIAARGKVIGWSCIAWSIGNCALPLIAWLIKRWKVLRAVCVIPMGFIFFCWKIIPESPRWLIHQGRTEEATEIMTTIAKTNKVEVPKDLQERVEEMANETNETSYGYISLFTSRTLAMRTICVTIGFTASAFVYYQLVINIGNMAGNIFLNMFLLGLVEGPGCAMGVILADKFGRRWTHCIMLLVNSILFFILMWIAYNPCYKTMVIVMCMWIKLNISGTFVLAYVQAMEVFPTCIRQSGIGFATLISQTISIGGPYVIYLGATDLKLPYLVMFLICLLGSICVSLIPETYNCKLPETIAAAQEFGKKDKFFSFLPSTYQDVPQQEDESGDLSTTDGEGNVNWNAVMKGVFGDSVKDTDLDANMVKHIIFSYYNNLKESKVDS